MFAVRKNLVLLGQICAARINQVNAGQVVLASDLLGAQMLLYGDREIGPSLYRSVVGDNDALLPHDPADSCDNPGCGD